MCETNTLVAEVTARLHGEEAAIRVEVQTVAGEATLVTVLITPTLVPTSLRPSLSPSTALAMGCFSLPPATAALSALLFALEMNGSASSPTSRSHLRRRYGSMLAAALKPKSSLNGSQPGTRSHSGLDPDGRPPL